MKLICCYKSWSDYYLMSSLLQQIKKRRLALGLKQYDMLLRIGVSRQQYQRLEAKGNPRLETLELVAMGLNSEIVLIPKEKLAAVLAILESDDAAVPTETPAVDADTTTEHQDKKSLSDDPWQGLLGDES